MKKPKKFGKPHVFSVGPVGGTMTEFSVIDALQCKIEDRLTKSRCQGFEGHDGMCWSYDCRGWLNQWKKKKDIKSRFDIAASHTPPSHKLYIHPKDKEKEHYKSFSRRKKIRTFQDDHEPSEREKRFLKNYAKHKKRKN